MLKKGSVFNEMMPNKCDSETGGISKVVDCAWVSVSCTKRGRGKQQISIPMFSQGENDVDPSHCEVGSRKLQGKWSKQKGATSQTWGVGLIICWPKLLPGEDRNRGTWRRDFPLWLCTLSPLLFHFQVPRRQQLGGAQFPPMGWKGEQKAEFGKLWVLAKHGLCGKVI